MKLQLLRLFRHEYKKRKKKTALITFAIGWGALSLLIMMAFGQGLSNQFRVGFEGLGVDLIMFSGGRSSQAYQGLPKGRVIRLYAQDVDMLRQYIPEIKQIGPESIVGGEITYKDKETNRTIHGVSASFQYMRSMYAQVGGRFINPDDEKYSRRVVFIGWKMAEQFFGKENPIGTRIDINRQPFTIIGIMKKKLQTGNYSGFDYDDVYVPFSTLSQVNSQKYIDMIHIQPIKRDLSKMVTQKVKEILGKKYRFDPKDEYALFSLDTIDASQQANKVFFGIEIFLAAMGALTLFIAAVGVTNLMYAVVKERTREIGVKMALGAKRRHVVFQFLLEALFIFLKGTFWGTLVAFDIVSLVREIPYNYEITNVGGYLLRPVFSVDILITFIIIMSIMVFFSGIFPALRASRLNPVDALRYE